MFRAQNKGFTLIELLVVISIISLLSSIVLAGLNSARAKGRNSLRLQNIVAFRTALNLYASDNTGSYPAFGPSCLGVPTGSTCWSGYIHNGGGSGISGNTNLNTALAPYIKVISLDPQPTRTVGNAYVYFQGTADIHCNGTDSVAGGTWLAWQPDQTSPGSDSACTPGKTACCSGIGCGSHNFCVLQIN